jgi:hypothetical protein
MTLQERAHKLFEDQKNSWPLLGANWDKLRSVRLKEFGFKGFTILVQFNPKRITSSAAKVDTPSIQNRRCFLCAENRPREEQQVWFGDDYEILCNPFPTFNEHFTIAKSNHTPQVIEPEFDRLLELSRELPDLALFYNAPNCGASAPDHMHFQAGSRGFMPIEAQLGSIRKIYGEVLVEHLGITITAVTDGLRRFYIAESGSKHRMDVFANVVLRILRILKNGEEPMINMLSYFNNGWQLLLFPREKHRPWQYFEVGEKNILLSPASVDMGGTLILPLEKDFQKITREDVEDIFSQVTFSEEHFLRMNELIKHGYQEKQ